MNVSVTKLITWYEKMKLSLFTGFLQVSDQVVSVLFLLQPTEGHLGTRDVFLWVGQVIGHVVFVPLHVLLDVGVCVRAVSYTHLDVYKRQVVGCNKIPPRPLNASAAKNFQLFSRSFGSIKPVG